MKPIAAKLGVSLLRYCNHLLVDRAFYNAGAGCRDANLINMAFVFFNRFVDLTDLIEKPDNVCLPFSSLSSLYVHMNSSTCSSCCGDNTIG
jgi:hypothetical protein